MISFHKGIDTFLQCFKTLLIFSDFFNIDKIIYFTYYYYYYVLQFSCYTQYKLTNLKKRNCEAKEMLTDYNTKQTIIYLN